MGGIRLPGKQLALSMVGDSKQARAEVEIGLAVLKLVLVLFGARRFDGRVSSWKLGIIVILFFMWTLLSLSLAKWNLTCSVLFVEEGSLSCGWPNVLFAAFSLMRLQRRLHQSCHLTWYEKFIIHRRRASSHINIHLG